MDFIDLDSPYKKDNASDPQKTAYPVISRTFLPVPRSGSPCNFFDVIQRRTSEREFRLLSMDKLSDILWVCSKSKIISTNSSGRIWCRKGYPSAGGLHCIDQLVFIKNNTKFDVYHYNHISHSLDSLEVNGCDVTDFMTATENVLSHKNATVVWNVAKIDIIETFYGNCTSLVFRDEGVIQGTYALAASASLLNFCSIGITGEPYISNMLKDSITVRGVGGFYLGEPI
jgi:SagB-type dehydrogenase family enzyme